MSTAWSLEEAHFNCSLFEPCEAWKVNPKAGASTCPKEPAREMRRKAKAGQWSALVLRQEAGGMRHYLDGKPVHCGDGLEIQMLEMKADDYGEYPVPQPKGIPVRYEAAFRSQQISWSLHRDVGGHEFTAVGETWHRFRWPK